MAKLALFLVVVCFQFFMAEELLAHEEGDITLDDETLARLDRELEEEYNAYQKQKSMSRKLATAQGDEYDEYDEEEMVPSVTSAKGSGKYATEGIMRRGRSAEEWLVRRSRRFTSSEPNNRNKRAAEEWAVRRS